MSRNILGNLPSVNELLENPTLKKLAETVSRNVVVAAARSFLDNLRSEARSAAADMKLPGPGELAERIAQWILVEHRPALRPVINATGVILDQRLGGVPLAAEALEQITASAAGYAGLDIDVETGRPAPRARVVERLLKDLTGAEAAIAVNSHAAAVVLALAALASGREVIISRGEMAEIDEGLRLPDLMRLGGCRPREVGTTNKTWLGDYADALSEQVALLLRVRADNFTIVGGAERPSPAELAALGRKRGVPVVDCLASGALVDLGRYGLDAEPVVADSIKAGADVVLFSGGKLVGGPPCGIVVGRRKLIEKLASHPMMGLARPSRIVLAALAATLSLYRDADTAERSVPLLSLLSSPSENLKGRAERLAPQLAATAAVAEAEAIEETTFLGGDPLPARRLPTWCIVLTPAHGSTDTMEAALRSGATPILVRRQGDRLLLDLRAVLPRQDAEIVDTVASLCGEEKPDADVEPALSEKTALRPNN